MTALLPLLAPVLGLALAAPDGPAIYEVPSSGVPAWTSQPAPLFRAARFEVRGGRVSLGAWQPSHEILGDGVTRVVVVASWCSACRNLLGRLAAERPRDTVVLFLERERERFFDRRAGRAPSPDADQPLAYPEILEGYPFPLHLLRSGSALERQVRHYPFHFNCSRTRCTPERGPS